MAAQLVEISDMLGSVPVAARISFSIQIQPAPSCFVNLALQVPDDASPLSSFRTGPN
jgi:hypothetical protein